MGWILQSPLSPGAGPETLRGAGWHGKEDAGPVTNTLLPFRCKSSGCFIPCKATTC